MQHKYFNWIQASTRHLRPEVLAAFPPENRLTIGLIGCRHCHTVRFFAREYAVFLPMSSSSCPIRYLVYLCSVYFVGLPAFKLLGRMLSAMFAIRFPAISANHPSLDSHRLPVFALPYLDIFTQVLLLLALFPQQHQRDKQGQS